jgi:hypothetical protein
MGELRRLAKSFLLKPLREFLGKTPYLKGAARPFFPSRPRKRGGQWRHDRTILNGIFGRLNTGAP